MSLEFDPNEMSFAGLNHPVRAQSAVAQLEVEGRLPDELQGAYYRVGPDPTFPPFTKNYAVIDGNGLITSFHFHDGQVDFRSRYVRTERYELETAANRALFGAYRNPFSDDPAVRGRNRGTANTTMRMHGGILWALKEDSLGIAIEPVTLETCGPHDFGGRVTSKTMTAHPKIDPVSGEMVFYGAAAKGETTPDIAVYIADAHGAILKEEWLVAPYASMVHDFAVTENWIIFPIMPTASDLDRMRAGGPIYDWQPERGMYLGLLPRRGTAADIRWVHSEAHWFYHVMNAYESGDQVYLDVAEMGMQPFPFFHADPARTWNPFKIAPQLTRWTVDTRTGSFVTAPLSDLVAEMPRIDERRELQCYRYGFVLVEDPAQATHGVPGEGPMNSLGRFDHNTGEMSMVYAGDHAVFEEPQFVPRSETAPEGDGFLMAMRHHHDTLLTDFVIYDTADLTAGPVAVAKLPFRTRPGTHGNWVPA